MKLESWRRTISKALLTLGVLAVGSLPAHAQTEPRFLFKFGRSAIPTPATFSFETGLAVDSVTGDVWVPGAPIKRFDADGNFILSAANCAQCMGMDVNLVNHDLYVANPTTAQIFQYSQSGQLIRQWGTRGTGNGQFAYPNDVSVDSDQGELYVIDGRRVQVFDLVGNFLRGWGSVGSGAGQFSGSTGVYGIAFDPNSRRVWVSDSIYRRIQGFDDVGNYLVGWGDRGGGTAPGQMRWIRNVDVASDGNVYEADSDNERIQVFDPQGNFQEEFMGLHDLANGPFHPRAIAINRTTGDKYVMAAYAQRIDKFDANNAYVLSWGDRERNGEVLWGPRGIEVDQLSGDLFVMDSGHFLVKRFTRTGAFVRQWGGSSRLDPLGDGRYGENAQGLFGQDRSAITTDRFGFPWVAGGPIHYPGDPLLDSVRRFDPDGNYLFGWKPDLPQSLHFADRIWGIAIDPVTDRAFVSDALRDVVRVHAPVSGEELYAIPVGGEPAGILLDGNALYVVVSNTKRIRKFTLDGTLLNEWGGPGSGDGQFAFDIRSGITLDRLAHIVYVADTNNHRIQYFDANGTFLGKFGSAGAGNGRFSAPCDVTIASSTRTLYVADTFNNRVQAFALPGSPLCFDGIDNDGDGAVDYPADPQCNVPARNSESASARCGIGFEIAFALPLLLALRRRRGGAARSGGASLR